MENVWEKVVLPLIWRIFGSRAINLVGIRIHFNDLTVFQLVRTGVSFDGKERTEKNGIFNR